MNEQQIKIQLTNASQREDIAHIKYLFRKNAVPQSTTNKDSMICRWEDEEKPYFQKKKASFFSPFEEKTYRYSALQKEHSPRIEIKRFSQSIIPPKTVNIKLKLPSCLQHSQYLNNGSLNILPTVPKRVLLPLNYIRSLEKRKNQPQQKTQELFWPNVEEQKKFRKGKLLHLPRRLKMAQSPKASPKQYVDLRACISRQQVFNI